MYAPNLSPAGLGCGCSHQTPTGQSTERRLGNVAIVGFAALALGFFAIRWVLKQEERQHAR